MNITLNFEVEITALIVTLKLYTVSEVSNSSYAPVHKLQNVANTAHVLHFTREINDLCLTQRLRAGTQIVNCH